MMSCCKTCRSCSPLIAPDSSAQTARRTPDHSTCRLSEHRHLLPEGGLRDEDLLAAIVRKHAPEDELVRRERAVGDLAEDRRHHSDEALDETSEPLLTVERIVVDLRLAEAESRQLRAAGAKLNNLI